MTQDSAQELIHSSGRSEETPATRTVLISETTKVISNDSSRGVTHTAERAGSLRRPRKVLEEEEEEEGDGERWFMAVQ